MIRTLTVPRWSLFQRWLPTDVYLWVKAVLLTLLAIQLARLIWTIVTPLGPLGDWRPASPRALPEREQASLFATVNPFLRENMLAAEAAPALNLVLYGVRSGGVGGGGAIIGPPDGEQSSYAVGEEVAPGVKLAAVLFDHVILDQGGRQQKIFLPSDDAPPAGATPAAAPTATAAGLGGAFTLRPRSQGGRVTGAIVEAGSNAELFRASGFQSGDVVVAVNGARISSTIDIDQLRSSIVPGARLMLSVERGASTVPIALNVPGRS